MSDGKSGGGVDNTIIRVNVGGRVFETHRETLLVAGPGSKFHQMISSHDQESSPSSNANNCSTNPNSTNIHNDINTNNNNNSCATNGTTTNVGNPAPFSKTNSFTNSDDSSTSSFTRFNTDHQFSRNSSITQSHEKQEIFLDRDPECFEHILFYLRTCSLAGVRELATVEKLKVESEFYGLGQGFHDLLKSKERILNMTTRGSSDHYMFNSNVKKDLDLKKTYIVKLQIQLDKVEDYVKWDIERNENIIRIAIGHRTQCSTHMRYQVTEGDTYNLQMTLNVTTRMNETNRERLEKHIVKCIQKQFNANILILSFDELTHCAYCERLLPPIILPQDVDTLSSSQVTPSSGGTNTPLTPLQYPFPPSTPKKSPLCSSNNGSVVSANNNTWSNAMNASVNGSK